MVCLNLNEAEYQALIARYQLAHQDKGFRNLGDRAEAVVTVDGLPIKRVLHLGCTVDIITNDGWGNVSHRPGRVIALIGLNDVPHSVTCVDSKEEPKPQLCLPFTRVTETCPTPHE